MKNLESNLWNLKVQSILYEFLMVIPILTIFFLSKGLTLQEVFLIQAFFSGTLFLLEIPSGYFADKYGRKISVVLGSIFTFIGYSLYIPANSFIDFCIVEILLGIGISFISGAKSALLYDTLLSLEREKEYQSLENKFFGLSGYSLGIAGILGGIISAYNLDYVFYIQSIVFFVLIPLSLCIKEPPLHQESTNSINTHEIFTFLRSNTSLLLLMLYSGVIFTSTLIAVWFTQPFWQHLGVPIAFFGFLWAITSIFRGVCSHFTNSIFKYLGDKKSLLLIGLIPLLGYSFLYFFTENYLSLIAFLFFPATFALMMPLFKRMINEEVESKMRATILSVESLFQRLFFIILGPIAGYFLDIFSFAQAFLAIGVMLFVLIAIFLLLYLRSSK